MFLAKTDVSVEPLTFKNLEKTQELLQSVFPYCKNRKYGPEVSIEKYLLNDMDYFYDEGLVSEEYYISLDLSRNSILGTTGLSFYRKDHLSNCWLGWFCVNPLYRGNGIGKNLLSWTIKKAQQKRLQEMHIETSDHPNEAGAQQLYESLGFAVYELLPSQYFDSGERTIIYRKRPL